jgi:hypothetical protein
MLSTCAKLLHWRRYSGLCSTQVPHTYSVSQLQSSHECLSSNSLPKVAQIDVYTHGLEIRLLSCAELVPNWCNDAGILECALSRYPTHIPSPSYCHRMCICQAIGTRKSLKLTFIHPGSRIDCLYALNVFENASMMWVFWILLCICTTHIFALPTTVVACVFVKP